jgi:cytochrome oxidase Cu insertion factor (SCO1/SenC/PrrC family)
VIGVSARLHTRARESDASRAARSGETGSRSGSKRDRVTGVQVAAVLIGAALIGLGVGVAAHFLLAKSSASSTPIETPTALRGQATWAAGARPAPPISTLEDQSGHRFSLASLRGRPVAMEFFDSHCRLECPLAGRTLAAAERSLPRAQRPVLVVVSVNPLDTPASTRAAVRAWGLAGVAPWHWLRGTHAQLAPVWSAYHIFVAPERGDISHTEALYLIDRQGDERSGYLYPYVPASVAHDMRTLASARASDRAGRA